MINRIKDVKLNIDIQSQPKSEVKQYEVHMYTGDLGYGGSDFIGVLKGKNPSDFWTQNSKMWELIGDEGKKIFQRWMLLVNKREFKQFWYIEELSYIPD